MFWRKVVFSPFACSVQHRFSHFSGGWEAANIWCFSWFRSLDTIISCIYFLPMIESYYLTTAQTCSHLLCVEKPDTWGGEGGTTWPYEKSSVSFVQTQDLWRNLAVPGSETGTLKPGCLFRNLVRSHRANQFSSGVVFLALKKVPVLDWRMGNVVRASRNVWSAFKISYYKPITRIDEIMLFATVTH